MAQKLDAKACMTIHDLTKRDHSGCEITRLPGVTEGTVRYHGKRQGAGTLDGRARQQHLAERFAETIAGIDRTVAFEGLRYSVPFGLLGQRVEVRVGKEPNAKTTITVPRI